ncbi:phosphate ABC transporter permease PstA [Clostridium sp. MB05]|jgi:phosphate transport system permease protein|uniref:phosphate ABC transporter permease PstA n=1 Tax=Clostridium sp. MB05 TaxID=3376682 RepID=UPI0039826954
MRKLKENILKGLLWISAGLTVGILICILGFIFIKGYKHISIDFLTKNYSASGNGGILPMIVATLYTVFISIIVATPIGVLAAIHLTEYAKQGKMVKLIRFATESLSGIPSIVYGLFGSIFFVVTLKFGYSLLAGSLTVSIIILPVIIRTTEEALKAVPSSYKEASLGLGATRFQTLYKVVVPSAIPGILVGVILSVGRVVGESAAILLTAGTVAKMPKGIMSSARTLTVQSYLVTQEAGDIEQAAAVGIVLIVIILVLNISAKLITKKFSKANY